MMKSALFAFVSLQLDEKLKSMSFKKEDHAIATSAKIILHYILGLN